MPGLENGNCTLQGASDGTLIQGADPIFSFLGQVTGDDVVNTADTNGGAVASGITDWLHFESPLRAWAFEDFDFSLRGPCAGSSACSIWDWRLAPDDRILRNRSGAGTVENPPFVPGEPCPSPLDETMVLQDTSGRRFLINAMEVVGDGLGNENGLCEMDEACIYMPHLGPYLGSGDYSSQTCEMGGEFAGVTMYAYPDP
jgi:hypothetical protein